MLIEITSREEFEIFKKQYSQNNWKIEKIESFEDGYEVLIGETWWSMPINCGKWIKENYINPENDGIDHINIYSKGKTELGRLLSNFARTPFTCADGKFESIEGYFYWLGCRHDKLKNLYGFQAKKYGKENDRKIRIPEKEFKNKIKKAITTKIEQNVKLKDLLLDSSLPLTHYYNYNGKIVRPTKYDWITNHIAEYRNIYQQKVTTENLGEKPIESVQRGVELSKEDPFTNELKCQEMIHKFNTENENFLNKKDPYSNDLIFGADKTKNVVSCDVKGNQVHIYRETSEGIVEEIRPFKRWIMSNRQPNGVFNRLDGDLYFKYLKEYDCRKSWQEGINNLYKIRADKFTCYDEREAYMIRNGLTYYMDTEIKDVSLLSFDIETTGLNPEAPGAMVTLIANSFRKNGEITKKLFTIDEYKSEFEMIYQWCLWVQEIDPSILTGHNINAFDLHYLHTRTILLHERQAFVKDYTGGLPLGRDGSIMSVNKKPNQFRKDGSQSYDYHKKNIFGREIIDGFFLAIRYDFQRNFPSYGLKPIIQYLGLEKEDRIKWDFEKDPINKLWETDLKKWEQFKEYCRDDADDSIKIFDLMAPSQFYWTRSCVKTFQAVTESATGAQLNGMMVRSYIQEGHSIPKPSEAERFEGATSLGIPGVYRNVFGVDFASLYPSIIREYKIYDKKKDPKQSMLRLTEYFTLERFKNKKIANETGNSYYRDLEQSMKIGINSLYGFCGAAGLHFNSPKCASSITEHGRLLFEKVLIHFTGKGTDYWKEKL